MELNDIGLSQLLAPSLSPLPPSEKTMPSEAEEMTLVLIPPPAAVARGSVDQQGDRQGVNGLQKRMSYYTRLSSLIKAKSGLAGRENGIKRNCAHTSGMTPGLQDGDEQGTRTETKDALDCSTSCGEMLQSQ